MKTTTLRLRGPLKDYVAQSDAGPSAILEHIAGARAEIIAEHAVTLTPEQSTFLHSRPFDLATRPCFAGGLGDELSRIFDPGNSMRRLATMEQEGVGPAPPRGNSKMTGVVLHPNLLAMRDSLHEGDTLVGALNRFAASYVRTATVELYEVAVPLHVARLREGHVRKVVWATEEEHEYMRKWRATVRREKRPLVDLD